MMKKLIVCLFLLMAGCQHNELKDESEPATKVDISEVLSTETDSIDDEANTSTNSDLIEGDTNDKTKNAYPDIEVYDPRFSELDSNDSNWYHDEVFDYFDTGDNSFKKAIYALFYTGEFEGPYQEREIFTYIMRNYPNYSYYDSTYYEDVTEFIYEYNGELKSFIPDEPLHYWTIVQPGEEFRQHYFELFDCDVPESLNEPWYARGRWNADGYFKDTDMYVYYQYADGAFARSGWSFYLLDQQEAANIVDLEFVYFYSEDKTISENTTYRSVPIIYKQDWTLFTSDDIDQFNEAMTWYDIFSKNKDDFQRWNVQLLHRDDGTYALLNAKCINKADEINFMDDRGEYIKFYKKLDYDGRDIVIPQFNLTGSWSHSVNNEIEILLQRDRIHYEIQEDENVASIKFFQNKDELVKQFIFDKQAKKIFDETGAEIENHY